MSAEFFILFFCKIINNCKREIFVVSPQAQNEIYCFGVQVLDLSVVKEPAVPFHVWSLLSFTEHMRLSLCSSCFQKGELRQECFLTPCEEGF